MEKYLLLLTLSLISLSSYVKADSECRLERKKFQNVGFIEGRVKVSTSRLTPVGIQNVDGCAITVSLDQSTSERKRSSIFVLSEASESENTKVCTYGQSANVDTNNGLWVLTCEETIGSKEEEKF